MVIRALSLLIVPTSLHNSRRHAQQSELGCRIQMLRVATDHRVTNA